MNCFSPYVSLATGEAVLDTGVVSNTEGLVVDLYIPPEFPLIRHDDPPPSRGDTDTPLQGVEEGPSGPEPSNRLPERTLNSVFEQDTAEFDVQMSSFTQLLTSDSFAEIMFEDGEILPEAVPQRASFEVSAFTVSSTPQEVVPVEASMGVPEISTAGEGISQEGVANDIAPEESSLAAEAELIMPMPNVSPAEITENVEQNSKIVSNEAENKEDGALATNSHTGEYDSLRESLGEVTYDTKDPAFCYTITSAPKDIVSLSTDLTKWSAEVERCKISKLDTMFDAAIFAAKECKRINGCSYSLHTRCMQERILDYFGKGNNASEHSFPTKGGSSSAFLRADIKVFLQSNLHVKFTPRAVARIMHGIPSPAFPSTAWSKCHFWGRYSQVDFPVVMKAATAELMNMNSERGSI